VYPFLANAVCTGEVVATLTAPTVLICLVALFTITILCASFVVAVRLFVGAVERGEAARLRLEELRAMALIRAADAITTASLQVGLDQMSPPGGLP
jgi:hypothetical protein